MRFDDLLSFNIFVVKLTTSLIVPAGAPGKLLAARYIFHQATALRTISKPILHKGNYRDLQIKFPVIELGFTIIFINED